MDISPSDLKWIEEFYSNLERGFDKYSRPADYKERALKILYGNRRNLVRNQSEGATSWCTVTKKREHKLYS